MSIRSRKVHFVSLGCPKNRVDTEVMLGHLVADGYEPVERPQEADVVVVNTCGFIDEAKEESVDTVVELAELKNDGASFELVVAGCLSQRYAPELLADVPEIDHVLGTGNLEQIAQTLRVGRGPASPLVQIEAPKEARRPVDAGALPDPDFTLTASSPRVATQPLFSRYLKVSEGCSNTCAFCIIPALRGPQRSRPVADVAAEAQDLISRGALELNLIAQDLCAYGSDLSGKQRLPQLLRALDDAAADSPHPVWLRCLYAYPKGLTAELIRMLAASRHVVPYLDMPLQHISDRLLRSMRRGTGAAATRELVCRLRDNIPGLSLRTTFITGLPGESDADFDELCRFVEDSRFESVGVFAYSPQQDTAAASMPDQVHEDVAAARREQLMALQRDISRSMQEALIGEELDVLVEGVSEETDLLLRGRHRGQAPEIDGVTYINDGTASPGDLVRVCVDQALDYDIVGGIVGHSYTASAAARSRQ